MYFKQFFDEKLAQYAYLIGCQANGKAVVIDPMRDIDLYIEQAESEGLEIIGAFDTHIHADFLSGLREFAERGVKVYGSDEGTEDWKYEWLNGSDYDYQLLNDGDEVMVGNITIKAVHTPGHTPEHLSYLITDGAAADEPMGMATGDFVFVGDVGRPDLLESAAGQEGAMDPSARTLYKTVEEFKKMPEYMQIWPGHGAGSACGKALGAIPETTVGYELRFNPSIKAASDEETFVNFILEGQPEPPMYFARMKRDNKKGAPVLGGHLPQPRRLYALDLARLANREDVYVVDTREREDYMSGGHLPGSILATLNKDFNTTLGSFLTEDDDIYLIIDEHRVEEAVRDLVRIGLDNVKGFATPASLHNYAENGGELETIEMIDFEEAESRRVKGDSILDVRKASEYDERNLGENVVNLAHTRIVEHLDDLNKDETYLVHCQTGGRASVTAALLNRKGFEVALINDDINLYLDNKLAAKSNA
jgi:hydroxyacylglutathione hydrolase